MSQNALNLASARNVNKNSLWQLQLSCTLLLSYLIALALNFPGHYSLDSVFQLSEGIAGRSMSFNPPLMSALLGVFYKLHATVGFMMSMSAAFYVAIYLILEKYSPRFPVFLLSVLFFITLSPVVLIYNGNVWKDVFFANSALLAFGMASQIGKYRRSATVGAVILFALSALVRQQGILVSIIGCLYLALQLACPLRKRVAIYFLGILASLVVVMIFLQLVTDRAISPRPTSGISVGLGVLASYDIAAIAAKSPAAAKHLADDFGIDGVSLVSYAAQEYSPERVDYLHKTLLPLAPLRSSNQLYSFWGQAIAAEPKTWLEHRWTSWQALLTTNHDGGRCLPIHVGVAHDSVALLQANGHAIPDALSFLPQDSQAKGILYQYAYGNLYWFSGGIWFCIGLAAFAISIYSRQLLPSMLSASGTLFTLSYLIVGIACDFRYQYYGVVSTILACFVLLTSAMRRRTN